MNFYNGEFFSSQTETSNSQAIFCGLENFKVLVNEVSIYHI